MTKENEQQIIDSWVKNASPWIRAIKNHEIESRRLVTDRALIDTLLALSPQSLLDLGCGEGWLARQMTAQGIKTLGVDAVESLIRHARNAGGEFEVMDYQAVAAGRLGRKFDAVVSNFSMLGADSVEHLVHALPKLLNEAGHFVMQTLHPKNSSDQTYRDGWREGSWRGFNDDFSDVPPWYFRTYESWLQLIEESGFEVAWVQEPLHPETGTVCSLLIVARVKKVDK